MNELDITYMVEEYSTILVIYITYMVEEFRTTTKISQSFEREITFVNGCVEN